MKRLLLLLFVAWSCSSLMAQRLYFSVDSVVITGPLAGVDTLFSQSYLIDSADTTLLHVMRYDTLDRLIAAYNCLRDAPHTLLGAFHQYYPETTGIIPSVKYKSRLQNEWFESGDRHYVKASGMLENKLRQGVWVLETAEGQKVRQYYRKGVALGTHLIDTNALAFTTKKVKVKGKQKNRYGLINIKGEEVVPVVYEDMMGPIGNTLYIVEKDNRYGAYDLAGKMIIPMEYERLYEASNGLLVASKSDKYGLVDYANHVVLPIEYDWLGIPAMGLVNVQKGDKWGYVDLHNKVVIPFKFQDAYAFDGDRAWVVMNGKNLSIDLQGNVVGEWDKPRNLARPKEKGKFLDDFGFTMMTVSGIPFTLEVKAANKKFGVMDQEGHWVIPPEYTKAGYYWNGFITMYKGQYVYLFNDLGERIATDAYYDIEPFGKKD